MLCNISKKPLFFHYEETRLDDDCSIPSRPFHLAACWISISSVIGLILDLMYSFCVDGIHLKVDLFYFSLLKVCLDSGLKNNSERFHLIFFLQHLLNSLKNQFFKVILCLPKNAPNSFPPFVVLICIIMEAFFKCQAILTSIL